MSDKKVQRNYLQLLTRLKSSKEELNDNSVLLEEILDETNVLFRNVSDTSDLKLDAKVTELHSEIFLKYFTKTVDNKAMSLDYFIDLVNSDKLNEYYHRLSVNNKRCKFIEFIDFDYTTVPNTRRTGERLARNVKDALVPGSYKNVEEETNLFVDNVLKQLNEHTRLALYECVIDTNSFDKTVENIFNLSIAIRSKMVMLDLHNGSIHIEKYKQCDNKKDDHIVMDIDYQKYSDLVCKMRQCNR